MFEISESSYTRDDMLADMRAGLTPLEAAKRKWTTILEGGEDFSSNSCACCETYFDKENPKACLIACPLGGTEGCCNGDYSAWIKHQNEAHMHEHAFYAIRCPECEKIASDIYNLIEEKLSTALEHVG